MSQEHLFDELKRYVDFGEADAEALRQSAPLIEPVIGDICEDFYAHVLRHPDAARVFSGPEQVDRLKKTLAAWIRECFAGPWDDAYYERRARIGRRHVEIDLAQRYMFMAMSVIRNAVNARLLGHPDTPKLLSATNKLFDIELAIMLETFHQHMDDKLRRNERLAAYGQVAASIAHELRNPLGVMDSSLYLLGRRLKEDADGRRHVERLREQVDYSSRTIQALLDLVRDRKPDRRVVHPQVVVREAVEHVQANEKTEMRVPDHLPQVEVDPGQVARVVANLLANALDAAGAEGKVLVAAEHEGTEVVITVNDSGPGVEPTVVARLFEPLVTTKAQGIGLGLALAKRLVEENGGTISLGSGPLEGAAFEVRLPTA